MRPLSTVSAFALMLLSWTPAISQGSLMTPQNVYPISSDTCMPRLTETFQQEFDLKRWTFAGLWSLGADEVLSKLSTYASKVQLQAHDRDEIEKTLRLPGYEYYLLTFISDYSAAFEDVIVVQADGCQVTNRKSVTID